MRKQVQLGNNPRRYSVTGLRNAKDAAKYTNNNWFIYFEGDKVTGYSREKGQRNWKAEEL